MYWKSVVLLLTVLCLASAVQAQPDTMWTRTFGGDSTDICSGISQLDDGGYVIAGSTRSFGAGLDDFWIMKTNEDGDSLWSRTYGGTQVDQSKFCTPLADGGFALAGTTRSFGSGNGDFWLVRVNADGDSLWSRTFGGEEVDALMGMVQTPDGGFALAGYTYSFGSGGSDIWLLRADENGDSLWSRTFGGIHGELGGSLIQTTDGGFAIGGSTQRSAGGDYEMWLIRTDADGYTLWMSSYGIEGNNQLISSLAQTPDFGFALAGYTYNNHDGYACRLIRTDSVGSEVWARKFPGRECGYYRSVVNVIGGGFALCGWTGVPEDIWLERVDENGDSLWSQTFGGDSSDICQSFIQTSEKSFVIAGQSKSNGSGKWNMWLIKTSPDPVSVSHNGSVPYPSTLSLSSPYPNPFNSTVSVGFRTARPGIYALDVIDPQGRSMGVISQGYMAAGERRVVWDAAGTAALPAGEYWIRLMDARGGQDVKPIVLMK